MCPVTSVTAPTTSMLSEESVSACAFTWTCLIASPGIIRRYLCSKSVLLDTPSMTCCTSALSCGCMRWNIMSRVGFSARSYSKILYVSPDQTISPLPGFHPKLPVWLSLWASDKYASLFCSFASARFLSSISILKPIDDASSLVAMRNFAMEHPAEFPIGAPYARFICEFLSRRQHPSPRLDQFLDICRMDGRQPFPSEEI